MILISDGKANVSMGSGSPLDDAKEVAAHIRDAGISSFVIDSEQSFISFGLAHTLSDELGQSTSNLRISRPTRSRIS